MGLQRINHWEGIGFGTQSTHLAINEGAPLPSGPNDSLEVGETALIENRSFEVNVGRATQEGDIIDASQVPFDLKEIARFTELTAQCEGTLRFGMRSPRGAGVIIVGIERWVVFTAALAALLLEEAAVGTNLSSGDEGSAGGGTNAKRVCGVVRSAAGTKLPGGMPRGRRAGAELVLATGATGPIAPGAAELDIARALRQYILAARWKAATR